MIGSVPVAFGLQAVSLAASIGAFLLAWLAHRRSTAVRPLNLRVLLARDVNTLRDQLASLYKILDRAKQISQTGAPAAAFAKQLWDSEGKADRLSAESLATRLPRSDEHFFRLGSPQLEAQLVEVHGFSVEIARLRET